MSISVILGGSKTTIEREIFVDLFANSVVHDRAPYHHALDKSEISFADLVELARKADIPYVLFFSPPPLVRAQLQAKSTKLLQGLTKETFALNSRSSVDLCDIELIVKDLLRKQMLLRRHDDTLTRNRIIGLLRKPGATIEDDADALLSALELQRTSIMEARNKKAALELLIEHLEDHQVLVSRSVRGFMPQLIEVKFSGLTVKDPKVPYIFLARGDHGDSQEPEGRQIFTLTLLAVLVARGIFAPVTYDGSSSAVDAGREYDIVGQILMPSSQMRKIDLGSLSAIKEAADVFKVTPSATVVRAMRLGVLTAPDAAVHLKDLETEFSSRTRPQARQPKPVNAIRTYNGKEFSLRMLNAFDAGKLTPGDFCRTVCSNRIKPHEIQDFRQALA